MIMVTIAQNRTNPYGHPGTGISDISDGFINNSTGFIEALSGTIQLPNNFTNQGTIEGTATIASSELINSGNLTPGMFGTPGTLTLNGDYLQTSTGILEIGISDASHYGVLNINGNATWGGTLKVDELSGFIPTAGEDFIVALFTGTGTGNFLSIDTSAFQGVTFNTIYTSNGVELQVSSITEVPVASSVWLFGSALAGFIGYNRRKIV